MPRQSFIDARVARALPLDRLGETDRAEVSRRLGLAATDGTLLAQRLADRAFLQERLLQQPALCLVVLETLIESGGMSQRASLRALVCKRTGCTLRQVDAAVGLLLECALVLGLSAGPSASAMQLAVLAPAGPALYELLAGVSLPDAPPSSEQPAGQTQRTHRDVLALTALAAHRRPRLTRAGMPDRSSTKRMSKGLGVEIEQVEHALSLAMRLGLMVSSHEGIVPSATALVRAAQGAIAEGGDGRVRCARRIPAEGWMSVEALARALRSDAPGGPAFYMEVVVAPQVEALAQQLAELPGLQVAEHAGAHWVRRVAPTVAGGGGHVTSSFEVLLGPDADLATVARVGLCCELMRVDHVLSLRLTPHSVAAGLACGLDPNELRAALGSVGPHGLPDNVAFMVEDWIKTSRLAQLRRGTFLFTDDATADRLATQLGDDVLTRPARGVLELSASISSAVLDKTLSKAGVVLAASGSLDAPVSQRPVERQTLASVARQSRPESPLLPLPVPDAELRAAVLRARQSGDYGVQASASDESMQALRELEDMARQQGAPAALFDAIALMRKWQTGMSNELREWIARMPQAKRSEAETALGRPMDMLPWLLLNEEWRSRTLKMASDVAGLNRQALAVSKGGRLRPEGARVIALLERPQVAAAMARALTALSVSDETGAAGVYCEDCGCYHGTNNFDDEFEEWEEDDEPPAHAAALARQPLPGTMPKISPADVRALIGDAAKTERPLHVEVSDRGRKRVYSVFPDALRRRGRDEVLLATDLKSFDSRVFKLEDISAAQIDAE